MMKYLVRHPGMAFLFVALFAMIALGPARLHAQAFGSIVGTVTDSTGAAVPGATVSVTNLGTNESRAMQSDASGNFRFVNLLPATYKVTVQDAHYKRFTRSPITVPVDASVRVDATLEVGAVTETVEVTTQAPLLQTESGSLGSEVEGKQVEQMPLNGRNVMNLIALVPGVVPQGSSQGSTSLNQQSHTSNLGWGNYQIGGGIAGQSAEYIDGASINVFGNSVALVPTQDAIQEFKVATNAVSAEFGRFAGGVVEMTTKSGGNTFHGSIYEYLRNNVFNANDFFLKQADQPRPEWNQNQYGVLASGPIKKDKAFAMFSWEGFNSRLGIYTPATVPSYNMEHGIVKALYGSTVYDPTGNCTGITQNSAGDYVIPESCIDTSAKIFMGYFPTPSAANPDSTTWTNAPVTGDDTNQYTGRVDYNVSDKQKIFGRYTYWHMQDSSLDEYKSANGYMTGNAYSTNTTHQVVLGDTYIFNPTTILDARLSFLKQHFNDVPVSLGMDESGFGANWATLSSEQTYRELPGIHIAGALDLYPLVPMNVTGNNWWENYALSASVTKIIGNHTLKFGGEARMMQDYAGGYCGSYCSGYFAFTPPLAGNEWAAFLLGDYTSATIVTATPTATYNFYQGYYVTDTWQANRNLTVDLGLRWELPGGLYEKKDRAAVILPTTKDPVTGNTGAVVLVNSDSYHSRSVEPVKHNLFAPRVSFAYRVNNDTVVRGGYGLTYLPPDIVSGALASYSPAAMFTTYRNTPTYHGLEDPFGVSTTPLPQPTGATRDPNFVTQFKGQPVMAPVPTTVFPYVQQWNLSVSRQIQGNWMVELGYAGSKGTYLPAAGNGTYAGLWGIDQITDSQAATLQAAEDAGASETTLRSQGEAEQPYPYFQNLQNDAAYNGSTTYHSMQLKTEKRFGNGGEVMAMWTWSKMIGDTDTTNPILEGKAAGPVNGGEGFTQDYDNLKGERSILSYNTPHRVVIDYVLNMPFGKGQKYASHVTGVADKLVSGWAVNGITTFQSGFALAINDSNTNDLTQYLGGGTLRPNYTAGCTKTASGSSFDRAQPGATWFNTSCFTHPSDFQFGNEPRVDGQLHAQGVDNFDFSILKSTKILEATDLQLRAEFFNIFNHPQFNPPGISLDGQYWGQVASSANTPRLVQMSLRLNF